MNRRHFYVLATILLLVPAIVYLCNVAANGVLTVEYLSTFFVSNYSFMSAPMWFVLAIGLFVRVRFPYVVCAMAAQGIVLIAFQFWVLYCVAPREGGLAWLMYIPVSFVTLVLVFIVLSWVSGHALREP